MNRTRVVRAGEPGFVDEVLAVLRAGGLAAFPTDTVYGLGAAVFDGRAVGSIYAAKDRPPEKAIPVLIAESDSLNEVARETPDMARRLAARFWPGPLTLVVPKQPRLPEAVSASDTVGVRVPDHDVARELLRAAGPLAVTSANLSGRLGATTAAEVLAQLDGRIDVIVDGGHTSGGVPSTVVDCTGPRPVILRPGLISEAEILRHA